MKSILISTLLATTVSAFPRVAQEAAYQLSRSVKSESRSNEKRDVAFDPAAQLVDVTGAHTFTPPDFSAGDQRGPCPGLNALANHNYLPHNGVAAWTDIYKQTVSGMSSPLLQVPKQGPC